MYILECSDGSYYTGSTNDLEKRLEQHQGGEGANHTRKRLPVELVYYEEFGRIVLAKINDLCELKVDMDLKRPADEILLELAEAIARKAALSGLTVPVSPTASCRRCTAFPGCPARYSSDPCRDRRARRI